MKEILRKYAYLYIGSLIGLNVIDIIKDSFSLRTFILRAIITATVAIIFILMEINRNKKDKT